MEGLSICDPPTGLVSTGSARSWQKIYPDWGRKSKRSQCQTSRTSWKASGSIPTRLERRRWDRWDCFFQTFNWQTDRAACLICVWCFCPGAAAQDLQQCCGKAGPYRTLQQACVFSERTHTHTHLQRPADPWRRWRRGGSRWRGETRRKKSVLL